MRTRKCNVTTITRPWYPFGVPPDARYDHEVVIGPVNIPNEHVAVITFSGKTPDCETLLLFVSVLDVVFVFVVVFLTLLAVVIAADAVIIILLLFFLSL